jgi:hypothetical protein
LLTKKRNTRQQHGPGKSKRHINSSNLAKDIALKRIINCLPRINGQKNLLSEGDNSSDSDVFFSGKVTKISQNKKVQLPLS